MERLSEKWIYENYDKTTLSRWISALRLFRFVRAWGGHLDDGDRFNLLIDYVDLADLKKSLLVLGIELRPIPEDYPRPIPGVSYKWDDYRKFKQEIYTHKGYEQPGKVRLLDRDVHVYIGDGLIQINVTSNENPYLVSEDTFNYCVKLENHLLKKGNLIFSYAYDYKVNYITKFLYPELFIHEK